MTFKSLHKGRGFEFGVNTASDPSDEEFVIIDLGRQIEIRHSSDRDSLEREYRSMLNRYVSEPDVIDVEYGDYGFILQQIVCYDGNNRPIPSRGYYRVMGPEGLPLADNLDSLDDARARFRLAEEFAKTSSQPPKNRPKPRP